MARSERILELAFAAARNDRHRVRLLVKILQDEERAKGHEAVADRFARCLKELDGQSNEVPQELRPLIRGVAPQRKLNDLILPLDVRSACTGLVEEHQKRDDLAAHALDPRNRILLEGPPGNGKTSLAECIATALSVPFYTVRYEGLIQSYMGATGASLARVCEFAASSPCVLFFDEFEVLGQERGKGEDVGEIRRVTATLLMQIDKLPSTVLAVVATNHAEMLDRATWRRFQLRLTLPAPSASDIEAWAARFVDRVGMPKAIRLLDVELPLSQHVPELTRGLAGLSFAELEEFELDVRRTLALNPKRDVGGVIAARLMQVHRQARPSNGKAPQ